MTSPAELITMRRVASNTAIAAKDAAGVAAIMTADVIVAVAGGPVLRGREANMRAFAEQMAEPGFGGYVRTPSSIEVAADEKTATEVGRWEGRWRVGLRTERTGGRYEARWACRDGVWLLGAETFVSTP